MESELELTGERFHPGLGGQIETEHVHRYAYISSLVPDRDVLDIASGEGYGSAHLALNAKSVVGVDVDSGAVVHASSRYNMPNLQFKHGTCENIPAESRSFDVVVSFETIEHIIEQEQFLKEVKRVLRPEGFAIISTPDKRIYSDEPNYRNPFHLKEFYEDEFLHFLRGGFQHVRILKQKFFGSSVIYGQEASGEPVLSEISKNGMATFSESQSGLYMIALVSNTQNNCSLPKSFLFGSLPLQTAELGEVVKQITNEVHKHEQTIRILQNHNLKLDKQIEERGQSIKALKADRKGVLDSLAATTSSLKEMTIQRHSLQTQLADIRIELSNYQQQRCAAATREQHLRIANELLKYDVKQLADQPASPVARWAGTMCVWYKRSVDKFQFNSRGREESEQLALIKDSGLFDAEYYLSRYADVINAGMDPAIHYLLHGGTEGRDPHPLFSSSYYLSQCPELAESKKNPLVHYLTTGHSRLDPNPFFQTSYYLEQRPDAAPTPLSHYIATGEREGSSPSILFDSKYYAAQNPELLSAGINLLCHYMLVGAYDGRQPHPLFDPHYYWKDGRFSFLPRFPIQTQRDLAPKHEMYVHANVIREWCQTDEWTGLRDFLSGADSVKRDPHPLFSSEFHARKYDEGEDKSPFLHYLRHGWRRLEQPHPLFDPAYYLQQYPGLANTNIDLLIHYLTEGAANGANPSADFDTAFYLDTYLDVANSGKNPLVHYVTSGMKEKRSPKPLTPQSDTTISIAQAPHSLLGAKA